VSKLVLSRVWDISNLPPNWFKREVQKYQIDESLESKVKEIITKVAKNGNQALVELTKKYDEVQLSKKSLIVSKKEINDAYNKVDKNQIFTLKTIRDKIKTFESTLLKKQNFSTTIDDIQISNVLTPIDSVGCYIPGGYASYPSTLLMTVIPAQVAGVQRIVICSPPCKDGSINPLVLVAANICGVKEIYKVGGAQAIAALAYGTESLNPVNKIVGPGNKYITMAKILVSKDVAIDMPAGPSEILIIADETANPKFVALDMISQAEHGKDSTAGLITTSEKLKDEVQNWILKLVKRINRSKLVLESLKKYGFIILCKTVNEAIELANIYAPEHLELLVEDSRNLIKKIRTAGLILLGPFSPVALSDYGSGTNHVLPTGGYARIFSGLSSLDFTRRVSVVRGSKKGLFQIKDQLKTITKAENLPNHFNAIKARFEND
jgi:histidinol dehydrogenase